MMLNKSTKAMVRSPYGNSNYIDIVTGVVDGNVVAPYLFIFCLDYVQQTSIDLMKENRFILTKNKKQTISHSKNDTRKLRKWSSASCSYNCPSQITAV